MYVFWNVRAFWNVHYFLIVYLKYFGMLFLKILFLNNCIFLYEINLTRASLSLQTSLRLFPFLGSFHFCFLLLVQVEKWIVFHRWIFKGTCLVKMRFCRLGYTWYLVLDARLSYWWLSHVFGYIFVYWIPKCYHSGEFAKLYESELFWGGEG